MDRQTRAWFEYLASWFKYQDYRMDLLEAKVDALLPASPDPRLAEVAAAIKARGAALKAALEAAPEQPP